MRTFDTFSYMGEADMLECRLVELQDVPDLYHVIVEADATHAGTPKPYLFADQMERFEPWLDRIVYVRAGGLLDAGDAESREHAQREWVWQGLKHLDAQPDEVVIHGDVDELLPGSALTVDPQSFIAFYQRFHPFAVDWLHPQPWQGPVIGRVSDIDKFADMRYARFAARHVTHAGWHFSWVSDGIDAKERKLHSFCYPELVPTWAGHLGECFESGTHIDGHILEPVEVDGTWPKWIVEGHAPASWYRPVLVRTD